MHVSNSLKIREMQNIVKLLKKWSIFLIFVTFLLRITKKYMTTQSTILKMALGFLVWVLGFLFSKQSKKNRMVSILPISKNFSEEP